MERRGNWSSAQSCTCAQGAQSSLACKAFVTLYWRSEGLRERSCISLPCCFNEHRWTPGKTPLKSQTPLEDEGSWSSSQLGVMSRFLLGLLYLSQWLHWWVGVLLSASEGFRDESVVLEARANFYRIIEPGDFGLEVVGHPRGREEEGKIREESSGPEKPATCCKPGGAALDLQDNETPRSVQLRAVKREVGDVNASYCCCVCSPPAWNLQQKLLLSQRLSVCVCVCMFAFMVLCMHLCMHVCVCVYGAACSLIIFFLSWNQGKGPNSLT